MRDKFGLEFRIVDSDLLRRLRRLELSVRLLDQTLSLGAHDALPARAALAGATLAALAPGPSTAGAGLPDVRDLAERLGERLDGVLARGVHTAVRSTHQPGGRTEVGREHLDRGKALGQRVQAVAAAGDHDRGHTGRAEQLGHCLADAAGCTGDEC